MRILIAYDSFLNLQMLTSTLNESLGKLAIKAEINSYEVKASDTPIEGLPDYLDKLTFGSPQDLLERIQGVDVLIVHKAPVTAEVIEMADQLKVIGCPRTGPGNVDIDTATKKKIPVVFAPGRNAVAVSEVTMGLIINELRHLCRAQNWLRNGNWTDPSSDYPKKFFTGIELEGKTLGIVGFGQIGRRVAQRAKAFEMKLLIHDPYVNKEEIEKIAARKVDLDTLLKESDIITLHVRLPEGTPMGSLIGKRELSLMKKSAYIINTSDGCPIDQEALYEALKTRLIAGAAQDSWPKKPVTLENPLLSLNNITITPGCGGAAKEIPKRGVMMVTDDIARVLRGERPVYIKNPEVYNS